MGQNMPLVGTAVEVHGVLGSFIGGDFMSDGDIYFTIKACASNVRLIASKLSTAGAHCFKVSDELIQVPFRACKWRSAPAGGLFDDEAQTMLGHTDGCLQASKIAMAFQATLSRRNRACARSRWRMEAR